MTRRGREQARARERGQSLVEFAFIFPLIALLAFGFIDVGRAVFTMNTLSSAARAAVRVAAVNQLDPGTGPWRCLAHNPVEDQADPDWTFRGCAMSSAAALGVAGENVTVSYAPPAGTTLSCSPSLNVGCIVTVTVVALYTPITPVAGSVIGPISMTSTSSMPIERLFP